MEWGAILALKFSRQFFIVLLLASRWTQGRKMSCHLQSGRGEGAGRIVQRAETSQTGICGVDVGRIWRGEQGWVSPRAGEVRLDMYVEQDVHTQV